MAPRPILASLAVLAALTAAAAAVHIVFDETSWTKQHWDQQKLDPSVWSHLNPSAEALASKDALEVIKRSTSNSLDGPIPRRTASPPAACAALGGAALS